MAILTIPPVHVDLKDGHYMVTHAELDTQSNQVMAHTDMTCTNKIGGFHGGVQLLYYNDQHQQIGQSDIQQWGIDQAPPFGAAHRSIDWPALPPAPAGTAGLAIAQFWDPKNAFGDIGNALSQFFANAGAWIAGAVNAGVEFCDQNTALCTGILVAVVAVVLLSTGGASTPVCVLTVGSGLVCTF